MAPNNTTALITRDLLERKAGLPEHPGTVLRHMLAARKLDPTHLAHLTGMPDKLVQAFIAGECAVTAEMALRLGHCFGNRPRFWLNLQVEWDLATAEAGHGEQISAEVRRVCDIGVARAGLDGVPESRDAV